MSAAQVIHFGFDECRRTPVMRAAGFRVNHCLNIPDLQMALRAPADTDLICISETLNYPREDALVIARAASSAPIILFRNTDHHYIAGRFDLEVESLTPPDLWLIQMDTVIARSREMLRRSEVIFAVSRELQKECAVVREQSQALRRKIAERRAEPDQF